MRKTAIRRPGGPAGVGPVDGPWGRTSAIAGWLALDSPVTDPAAAAVTESRLGVC